MEDIIIGMLYLYPGALVDLIRKTFFKRVFRDDDLNESTRIAKYFWFSTFITVAALLIYADCSNNSVANPEDIKKALSGTMEIPKYFGISFCVTVAFTFLLEGVKALWSGIRSLCKKKREGTVVSRSVTAWHELICGKGLKEYRGNLVLKIKNGGEEKVGFFYFLPDEFKDGISLIYQPEVEEAFTKDEGKDPYDESRLIKGPVALYYDPESGTTVEFYDGTKFNQG
ncbi:MAG: hypothetical protein IKU38_08835 [Clostridia bacterium]|nr:hypothetical protein [Clostridia bacterium]